MSLVGQTVGVKVHVGLDVSLPPSTSNYQFILPVASVDIRMRVVFEI